MVDYTNSPDKEQQETISMDEKRTPRKRSLDTYFPTPWLLAGMVALVLIFNLVVGVKVFTLQKEKAVIEILKARYESYEKLIHDIEEKQDRVKRLTEEIVPLERRKDDALTIINESEKKISKNNTEINKINAHYSEVDEELNAKRRSVAELSNEKQGLRDEKNKLFQDVERLKAKEHSLEAKISEHEDNLKTVTYNLDTVTRQLQNQKQYLQDISAANSNFDNVRSQLENIVVKFTQSQIDAGRVTENYQKLVNNIEEENSRLEAQNLIFTTEAKVLRDANVTIGKEIDTIKEQNKGFGNNVRETKSLSQKVEQTVKVMNGFVVNVEVDTGVLHEAVKGINDNLTNLETSNKAIKTTKEKFQSAVSVIDTQAKNLDIHMETISKIPDMKKQTDDFVMVSQRLQQTFEELKQNVLEIDGDFESIALAKEVFQKAVSKIDNQAKKLDRYMQTISEIPDMQEQVEAFVKVRQDIQRTSDQLKQNVSKMETDFGGKLDNMQLSFNTLEQEVAALAQKTTELKQIYQTMVLQGKRQSNPIF